MEFNRNFVASGIDQGNRLTQLKAKADFEDKRLKEAADGFEEIFVHKLLQVMRSTIPEDGLISGGHGEKIFRDMLDQNYAKLITKSGALGLSKIIYENTKLLEKN